jgi:hypothetical protein
MRAPAIAIVMLGLLAVPVQAADDAGSSVATKLPDNMQNHQLYLFTLKKNGLSIRVPAEKFCNDFGYGVALKWCVEYKKDRDDSRKECLKYDDKGLWESTNDEYGKDGVTKITGELVWVICELANPPAKPKPDTK